VTAPKACFLAEQKHALPLRALDLFCGAGGATKGLQRAGFHVTGVDLKLQPRYCGDVFVQADALRPPVDLRGFDFIWASPPCQAFTALRNLQRTVHGPKEYPNLIPQTRAMLESAGVPFAIENVEGAPLGESGFLIVLCGTMFGLQTPDGAAEIRRHRLFETSFSIPLRPACQHGHESLSVTGSGLDSNADRWAYRSLMAVTGNGATSDTKRVMSVAGNGSPRTWDSERGNRKRRAMSVTGSTPQTNTVTNRVRKVFSVNDARAAMGIDWMPMKYLSQAVPPAYSEFIAREFLASVFKPR
jgi:DNA (cytosine-5)-methyltransferase 1